MPSSMLLMTVSSRSRWLADLADQAGHRVGHRVELARQPRDRCRSPRPARAGSRSPAGDQARRRLEALQPAQHDEPDDERDGARRGAARGRRCPPTIQRRSRFIAARISPASRSRIRMPLMRCAGSWQRWQASRLRNGITVRRIVAAARLDDAARVRAAPAGAGGTPGRSASRGRGRRPVRAARSSSARRPWRSSSITLLDARLPGRSSAIIRAIRLRSFSIIWCSSADADQLALRRAPSLRAVSSSVSKWWTE